MCDLCEWIGCWWMDIGHDRTCLLVYFTARHSVTQQSPMTPHPHAPLLLLSHHTTRHLISPLCRTLEVPNFVPVAKQSWA